MQTVDPDIVNSDIAATRLAAGPYEERSTTARLVSLDTYRGMVMLLMASDGFRFGQVAQHFPDSDVWKFLARQSDHVRWQGCTLWDLIMPAFLFMVGVALPFSIASRRRRGQRSALMFTHALWRSIVLVVLGIIIMLVGEPRSGLNFINVLAQIGLSYWFVFLMVERSFRTQALVLVAILAGSWLWFYSYPLPADSFDYSSVGVPAGWHHPEGIAAHWDLNTNPAAAFDRWFLNLFPRTEPFQFREGGGTTLNFIPAIATMMLGVMAGSWLRGGNDKLQKVRWLLIAGVLLLAAGIALDPAILPGVDSMRWTICPIIKRLWTPSYVLYSGGWVMLIGAALYWLIDVRGVRRWTFPFVIVGMNSIVMYLLAALSAGWIRHALYVSVGHGIFETTYGPILESLAVLAICWSICLVLYKQRVFVRI
jgi:heparan-alpha-glucosaminide N-acetyltransferase